MISPYRKKSIRQIERELEAILDLWPRAFIELADDNSFVDKAWSLRVAEVFRGSGVRWFSETDISIADEPALLDALAKSGCVQLLTGLESPRAATLKNVDSRGWKAAQRRHYREKVARIQSAGIALNGCFVVGFDEDDRAIFADTLEFIDSLELAEVQVTLLTAFPGTSLFSRLESEGRLFERPFWDRCTLFDLTFEPARMSAAELREGFYWLMGQVYSDDRTAVRKRAFRQSFRSLGRKPMHPTV